MTEGELIALGMTRESVLVVGIHFCKATRSTRQIVEKAGVDWDGQFMPFLRTSVPSLAEVLAAKAAETLPPLPPIDWAAVIAAMMAMMDNCPK